MDAIDDLGDAIDVTRDLLFPVRVGLWIKLAIVVLFVAGIGLGGGLPTTDVGPLTEDPGVEEPEFDEPPVDDPAIDDPAVEEPPEELPTGALAIVLVVLFAIVLLWLLFAVISAIMEFVFVESLRSTEVHIRRFFRENLGRGIRLFLFRFGVGVLAASSVVIPALLVVLAVSSVEAAVGFAVLLLLYAFVVYLLYAVVMRFTSEFVAPVMLLEDRGVLSAWSRFWGTMTSNAAEYVVYLILVWILQLVANIAIGLLWLIGGLLLAIPFVILFVVLLLLGEIGMLLAIPLAILGFLVFLLFVALVQMPVRTYFQYYALLLLGDTNDELDLIPDQREAVRAGKEERGEPVDRDAETGPDASDGHWGQRTDNETRDDGSPWDDEDDRDELWDTGDERDRDDGTDRDDDGSGWDDGRDEDDEDRGW